MKFKEQITLVRAATVLPPGIVDQLVGEMGFRPSGASLVFRGDFNAGVKRDVEVMLRAVLRPPTLRYTEFVEYEAVDFRDAAALELSLPEIWLDAVPGQQNCSECGRQLSPPDFSQTYDVRVPSNVAVVNGDLFVVGEAVASAALGMTGADFPPFTRDGAMRYVRIARDLAIAPDQQDGEAAGACASCGRSLIRPRIGPLRFLKEAADGVDVFCCSSLSTIVFSREWAELLQRVNDRVELWRPVVFT